LAWLRQRLGAKQPFALLPRFCGNEQNGGGSSRPSANSAGNYSSLRQFEQLLLAELRTRR
jgi:hypothetical protein